MYRYPLTFLSAVPFQRLVLSPTPWITIPIVFSALICPKVDGGLPQNDTEIRSPSFPSGSTTETMIYNNGDSAEGDSTHCDRVGETSPGDDKDPYEFYAQVALISWPGWFLPLVPGREITPEPGTFDSIIKPVENPDSPIDRSVTISGRIIDSWGVGLPNIEVRATSSESNDSQPCSTRTIETIAETTSDGSYFFDVSRGWTGTVAPNSSIHSFEPSIRTYTSLNTSLIDQDFPATPSLTTVVHGLVRDHQQGSVSGVPLLLTGINESANVNFDTLSDKRGHFRFTIPRHWTGLIRSNENYRIEAAQSKLNSSNKINAEQDDIALNITSYRNYYVSVSNAANEASGFFDAPFSSIQQATDCAKPGDTIYLRGGLYDLTTHDHYDRNVIYFASPGTPGQPITLQAFANESVLLRTNESKPIFDFSPTFGHNTVGMGHFVFRRLKIVGGAYGWLFRPPVPNGSEVELNTIEALNTGQIHDVLIEDCEVDGQGTMQAAIYTRDAGIRNLTVRRCNFHHTTGTEGTVDIGEWSDNHFAHAIPQSASRRLLFEDCQFHHALHQQASGIVFQPCNSDVTLSRCSAWNNGKYGFACKGSGNFRLDRCAAWGNDSSQMYCRGFGGDSGAQRPPFHNDFLITNSIFIAPADQRGGAALNWRQNCNLRIYHCTIVGLRDTQYSQSGGYPFLLGDEHALPCIADVRNCIVAGFNQSSAVRFYVSNDKPFVINTSYRGNTNLFFSTARTHFRYQHHQWDSLTEWQNYWRLGEPQGDDGVHGPRPTEADAASLFADPKFVVFDSMAAPLRKQWRDALDDPENYADIHLKYGSPAIGLGENLSHLGMSSLQLDYEGHRRPAKARWTVGAIEPVPTSETSGD